MSYPTCIAQVMNEGEQRVVGMHAYPDSKCVYGYMTVCDECKSKVPAWVNISRLIVNPPTKGKRQRCEMCSRSYVLE